jgi:hypothetical protein
MEKGDEMRRIDWPSKQREEAERKRMAGLRGLIFEANGGNSKPLCDFFSSGEPRHLSTNECMALAELLGQLLPKKKGRPLGSLNIRNSAIQCAHYLVWQAKQRWYAKHKRKRASVKGPNPAPVEALIFRAIELVKGEFPKAGAISYEDISQFTSKPSRNVINYVNEHMREAQHEMIDIALK